MASAFPTLPSPLTLHPIARAYAYREVAAAGAAAFGAHYCIDLAEGALVDCDDVAAEAHIADAITEARRFFAHLGFAVLPFDEAPHEARDEAERLIQGGA